MQVAARHVAGRQVATITASLFQNIIRHSIFSVCRCLVKHAVSSRIIALLAIGVADIELGNWRVGVIVDVVCEINLQAEVVLTNHLINQSLY